MESRIVSISRTLAAGGEEIGRLVANELDFRYVDDEIIVKAAEHAGVSPETVGEVEHSRSLIERVCEGMATGGGGMLEMGYIPNDVVTGPRVRTSYQNLIQQVILETAETGQVVFLAHGSSIPLAGMSGLLRVLVTASAPVRAERLMGASEMGEREATRAVQDSDRERQNFFRRFYNIRRELPIHYDLVVNTDRLDLPWAARLIVTAAKG